MNRRIVTAILATTALLGVSVSIFVYSQWQKRVNPYERDGLNIEWDVRAAAPAYPWINVWVDHGVERIKPELKFGGMENPRLRFIDYNEDGRRDIVFGDDHRIQIVAFYPSTTGGSPRFDILRNDVVSP